MTTTTVEPGTAPSVRDVGQPAVSGGLHDTLRQAAPPHGHAVAEMVAGGLSLAVCVVARLPHRILEPTAIRSWAPALLVVVSVVAGARAIARAPFTLHHLLHAGPHRRPVLLRWAGGEVKTTLAAVTAGTLTSLPLYALVRSTTSWWLAAWVMFAAITLLWQLGLPLAVRARSGSAASRTSPLAARVRAVGAQAGVDVGDVLVAGARRDGRANAYVVGLGRSRRVVLEQGLAAWPPELIDQVVAHELGHWRLGHLARRLPLTLLAELAALAAAGAVLSSSSLLRWAGVTAAGDPRSYPLLLIVGAAVALPARCLLAVLDRSQERAADRFALELLQSPASFDAMLQRAADDGGAPRTLSWWQRLTASHPPIDERAAACRPKGT